MGKARVDSNVAIYPMPVVLVGAIVDGKANFLAVGWIARVNYQPPLVAISLGKGHYTNGGIREHKQFSVNFPSLGLLEKTDYCGMVSGRDRDKSQLFSLFDGALTHAPMIRECPQPFACTLINTVELPSNDLFIGEVVEAFADEACLTHGEPDATKMNLFTLTMPDNNYWKIGDQAGKAWGAGRGLM